VTITEGVRTLGFITQDDLGPGAAGTDRRLPPFFLQHGRNACGGGARTVEALSVDSANVMALGFQGVCHAEPRRRGDDRASFVQLTESRVLRH